jgi:lipid-A-disaccharide synthase
VANSVSDCILLVAAEASGAQIAAAFLREWKKQEIAHSERAVTWFGVGSEDMESLGFQRFGKAETMGVVGLAEVLEHYGEIKQVFNTLIQQAKEKKPQVAILIDYPGFNLRLAKRLDELNIPVVYYVSPQVWAWKKNRVEVIRRHCKKILVLFPFEKKFYEAQRVPVEFVGHPLLDALGPRFSDQNAWRTLRQRFGVTDDEVVVGIMPGSRKSEVRRHILIQMEVARRLHHEFPNIRVLLCVAPSLTKEWVLEQVGEPKFPFMVLQNDPLEMIHMTDLVLVASGTATLQVGLLAKPMVIMYRMNFLTGILASLIVRGVKYFGLVNLILGKEVCPERFQSKANVDELTALMKRYLLDEPYREAVREELKSLKTLLGEVGASRRAVQAVRNLRGETL